jgi:tetratricopeptide (TPR) repeat protein
MSPKSIARVRGILFMMDTNERQVLRNYLQCFESRKKGHKPKTLVLLQLLEKYPDDERVRQLFSKKVLTEDARRMVLSRLEEKMHASLTLDVNIIRPENYDDIAQARANVSQGKIAAQLLVARGQRETGLRELERSIALAKNYEIFHDLVEMLIILQQHRPTKTPKTQLQVLKEQIARYSLMRDAEVKARTYFDEVTRQYGFKGLSHTVAESARLDFIESRMLELKTAFQETNAATIGYYYYLLLIEFHQLRGQLEEASVHLLDFAQMVEHNPSIRNRIRLATAYANLGENEMRMHRFEQAAGYIKDSLSNLRVNSRNHALMSEYLFYAQFYSGNLDEARITLDALISNPNIDQSDFRKAVRSYLMGCVQFCMGNHGSVRKYLTRSQSIAQDKEGWNIGARILTILNSIERNDLDHADSLIINLRQFMREGLKGMDPRSRDRRIVDILVELRKESYDFNRVARTKQQELKALREHDSTDAWRVQTPELICFHTWFADKVQGKRYVMDYAPAHLFE